MWRFGTASFPSDLPCLPHSFSLSIHQETKDSDGWDWATVIFEAETEKPDIKVRWQRDSKDIASSYKYTISAEGNMHSLTINNIVQEDAVGYAVIAGVSKVKFELKIKESEGGWCLDGDSRLPVLTHFYSTFVCFFVNQSHSTKTNCFPIHFSRNWLAFKAPF